MSKVGKTAVILFLISLFFLFCGCSESEPRPEPKFGKGQKVIHRATNKECYVINPTYNYSEQVGWTCAVYFYITQEDIEEWKKAPLSTPIDCDIDVDGGQLQMCDHVYESMLESAEDDYGRY